MHIKIASIMLVASILGLGAIAPVATNAQSESTSSMVGGTFASVKTEITDTQIIITIDKVPGATPSEPGTGNVTIPEGPIVIVPPNNETGQNGTIIVPPVIEPPANVTLPDNVTLPVEPPVIIVDPEGNSTTVTPPSNVTVIDNDTVVVAPPDQPVTETPGNVTVIDPPAVNATEPGTPAECGCPIGVEGGAPDIQAPGVAPVDNTTIIVEQPEPGTPAEEPSDGGSDGNGNGDNEG